MIFNSLADQVENKNGIYVIAHNYNVVMCDFVINEILERIESKTVYVVPEFTDYDETINDSILIIDMDCVNMTKGSNDYDTRMNYTYKLRDFCMKNRNSIIVKKELRKMFSGNTTTSQVPNTLAYSADFICSITGNKMYLTKCRFDFNRTINLKAYLREKRIDLIFKD